MGLEDDLSALTVSARPPGGFIKAALSGMTESQREAFHRALANPSVSAPDIAGVLIRWGYLTGSEDPGQVVRDYRVKLGLTG
jgi:hypothetical protein